MSVIQQPKTKEIRRKKKENSLRKLQRVMLYLNNKLEWYETKEKNNALLGIYKCFSNNQNNCHLCKKQFKKEHILEFHLSLFHNINIFSCKKCRRRKSSEYCFIDVYELQAHAITQHAICKPKHKL